MAQDALHGGGVGPAHHEQAGGGVAQVVEPNLADDRDRPQFIPVPRAAPEARVRGGLLVPAAPLAAPMFEVLDDPGASEGPPKDILQWCVQAEYGAVLIREHQGAACAAHCLGQVGDNLWQAGSRQYGPP